MAILFIILAAIFKACADTMADHYDDSVFSLWNYKFWDKNRSWRYAKFLPFTKYKLDGWHIANSLMIVSFCAAAIVKGIGFHWTIDLAVYGISFILMFNVFYNKILR